MSYLPPRILVLFKPDACNRKLCSAMKTILQNHGFQLVRYTPRVLSLDELTAHYAAHKGKDWYDRLIAGMAWQPAVSMIALPRALPALQDPPDDDPVGYLRKLVGPVGTQDLNTIRGALRDPAAPLHQNLIHASDSAEAAEREIRIFYTDEV